MRVDSWRISNTFAVIFAATAPHPRWRRKPCNGLLRRNFLYWSFKSICLNGSWILVWSAISSAQSIPGINLHPSSTSLGFQHPMSLQGLMGMCFSAGLGEDGGWEGGGRRVLKYWCKYPDFYSGQRHQIQVLAQPRMCFRPGHMSYEPDCCTIRFYFHHSMPEMKIKELQALLFVCCLKFKIWGEIVKKS